MNKFLFGVAVFGFGLNFSAHARTSYESFPAVKKGGNYNEALAITPVTLNPLLINDVQSREVSSPIFMSLIEKDGETYENYPALAAKNEISKDKKEYSYSLNPNAKWTDGSAVTTDDVEYTFRQLMSPSVEAAALRGFYEGVSFSKIDQLKFKFRVENPRFNTEDFLNGFTPLQKKQFEKEADFNKSKENLRPIGSGSYVVKSISRDQSVVLQMIPNWWAKDLPQYKARINFSTLTYKIIPDSALAYEKFIKRELDSINFNPDQFITQVNGTDKERYGKGPKEGKALWAGKLATQSPMVWRGIALNLKNPILSHLDTRKGLAYLVDYKTIVELD